MHRTCNKCNTERCIIRNIIREQGPLFVVFEVKGRTQVEGVGERGQELYNFYASPDSMRSIISQWMRWPGHVAHTGI